MKQNKKEFLCLFIISIFFSLHFLFGKKVLIPYTNEFEEYIVNDSSINIFLIIFFIIFIFSIIKLNKKVFLLYICIFIVLGLYYLCKTILYYSFGFKDLINLVFLFIFIVLENILIFLFSKTPKKINKYFNVLQIITCFICIVDLIYIIFDVIKYSSNYEYNITFRNILYNNPYHVQLLIWTLFTLFYIRWIQLTPGWESKINFDFFKLRRFDTMENNNQNRKLSGADLYNTMEELKEINKAMYHDIHFMYIILVIFVVLSCIGFGIMIFGAIK